MTYYDLEQSAISSQPIELYDFVDANLNHWRYTSHTVLQNFESFDYIPDTINREAIELTSNHFKNEVQVTLGRDNLFAINYIAGLFESQITLQIYRLQGIDHILYWSGVVQRVVFDKDEIPTVYATPISSDIMRVGARRRCQIMCDLCLYDTYCQVDKELFRIDGTITAVSGTLINAVEFGTEASGWLTGGILIVGNAKRLIQWHEGNQIRISRYIPNLIADLTFIAYAGCDHIATTCLTKFENIINYGGAEFLPITNPFKNAIVY